MENSTKRKKIATTRSTLPAHRAAPSPISGQASGQYGSNIANPRKNFNEKTKNIREHVHTPTRVEAYKLHSASQVSIEITIKPPSSTYPSKHTANLLLGSPNPKREVKENNAKKRQSRIWSVSLREIHHSALPKVRDWGPHMSPPHKASCKTLIGSAKPIGLTLRRG